MNCQANRTHKKATMLTCFNKIMATGKTTWKQTSRVTQYTKMGHTHGPMSRFIQMSQTESHSMSFLLGHDICCLLSYDPLHTCQWSVPRPGDSHHHIEWNHHCIITMYCSKINTKTFLILSKLQINTSDGSPYALFPVTSSYTLPSVWNKMNIYWFIMVEGFCGTLCKVHYILFLIMWHHYP